MTKAELEEKIRQNPSVSGNLRRLRDAHGFSQEKVCAALQLRGCDIGRTTYARYESGDANVRVSVLMELKKLYACEYDEFFAALD